MDISLKSRRHLDFREISKCSLNPQHLLPQIEMDVQMVDLPWGYQSYHEVLQSIYFLEFIYCWYWLPLALPLDHLPPIGLVTLPLILHMEE